MVMFTGLVVFSVRPGPFSMDFERRKARNHLERNNSLPRGSCVEKKILTGMIKLRGFGFAGGDVGVDMLAMVGITFLSGLWR